MVRGLSKNTILRATVIIVIFVIGISVYAKTAQSYSVPSWVRGVSGLWHDGKVSDKGFVTTLEFLVNQNMIKIPNSPSNSSGLQQVPNWIKNTAGWWANGQISDNEFIESVQWLVNESIIRLPKSNFQSLANLTSQISVKGQVLPQTATVGYTNLTEGIVNGRQLTERDVGNEKYYFFPRGLWEWADLTGSTDPFCKSNYGNYTIGNVIGYSEYPTLENLRQSNYGPQSFVQGNKTFVAVIDFGNVIVFNCVSEVTIR